MAVLLSAVKDELSIGTELFEVGILLLLTFPGDDVF